MGSFIKNNRALNARLKPVVMPSLIAQLILAIFGQNMEIAT